MSAVVAPYRAGAVCKVEGCGSKVLARWLCSKHYQRFLKFGDPLKTLIDYEQPATCEVDGCDAKPVCKRMCGPHYRRLYPTLKLCTARWLATDAGKAKRREYKIRNREKNNLQVRERRRKNPEAFREWMRQGNYARRARVRGVEHEKFDRREIFARDGGRCAYCACVLDESNWHLDHVIPIARGGGHLRSNVVAVCPPCNISKKDKTADEFRSISCVRS